MAYKAPGSIREECDKQRLDRKRRMKEAFETAPSETNSLVWKPDEQDEIDERTVFTARDFVNQNNFGIARLEMHPDSVKRMEAGLEPEKDRVGDREWVARTARYNSKKRQI